MGIFYSLQRVAQSGAGEQRADFNNVISLKSNQKVLIDHNKVIRNKILYFLTRYGRKSNYVTRIKVEYLRTLSSIHPTENYFTSEIPRV